MKNKEITTEPIFFSFDYFQLIQLIRLLHKSSVALTLIQCVIACKNKADADADARPNRPNGGVADVVARLALLSCTCT